MNNFDQKNHEEQSSKILACLFNLYRVDHKHSSIDSVFNRLKYFNNEKKHGNSRPNNQSDHRCYYCNTLFYKCHHRNFRDSTISSCRDICFDKFNQLLSTIRTLRTKDLPIEKRIKSQQLTKYKSNGCIYRVKQIINKKETLWRLSA